MGAGSLPLMVVARRARPVKLTRRSLTESSRFGPSRTMGWLAIGSGDLRACALVVQPVQAAAPPSAMPCTKRRRDKPAAAGVVNRCDIGILRSMDGGALPG